MKNIAPVMSVDTTKIRARLMMPLPGKSEVIYDVPNINRITKIRRSISVAIILRELAWKPLWKIIKGSTQRSITVYAMIVPRIIPSKPIIFPRIIERIKSDIPVIRGRYLSYQ